MKKKNALLCASVCAFVLAGCSSTAEHLRTQPAIHFTKPDDSSNIKVPDGLDKYLQLRCMRMQDAFATSTGATDTRECIYVAAEAMPLAMVPNDKTNDVISFLMGVADMNCSNFLHRAFANKAGLDFTKTFTGDMATGVAAGTAHAHPSVAAALSVGNLVVGKGVEAFNATYYYQQTFQALKAVITANRESIRRHVFARQSKAKASTDAVPYTVTEAMSDIREYDDSCSMMSGLDKLVQVAEREKAKENELKRNVQVSDNPVKMQETLTGAAVVAPAKAASGAGK